MKTTFLVCSVWLCLVCAVLGQTNDTVHRTVIYDEVATQVATLAVKSEDVWVTLADLTRATRFTLKPQGVCRDELCFPLPKARRSEFLTKRGKTDWFNLSEFARLLRQPVAHDAENNVWYFGPRAEAQNSFLTSLSAPDFTLPDAQGKPRSLHEFRGKKVLLLTWASW